MEPTPQLTFRSFDGRHADVRFEFPGLRSGMRNLVAFTADGAVAAEIRWRKRGGEITLVWVCDHLQRHGVATTLLAEATRRQPDIHHSHQLTDDARAWIAALASRTSEAA